MGAYIKGFCHRGAGGVGVGPHYGNFDNLTAQGTIAPAIDTFWAAPFYLPEAGAIDKMAFKVTTGGGAGNKTRVGLFSNANDTTLYPDKLIVGADSGEIDSTGVAVTDASITSGPYLDAGLYWLVLWQGAGTVATYASVAVGANGNILGVNASLVGITGISVAKTYSASGFAAVLTNNTFPAGGAYVTAAMPLMAIRLAAG